MWILPKQLHLEINQEYQPLSVSAQGMEDWKEVSKEFSEKYEFSLFQKSKPIQSLTLSQRWKAANWKLHLCGRILKPSLVKCFETRLTSSLAAFPVSRFPVQAAEVETKIPDISSPTSYVQLELFDLGVYSLKTSPESLAQQSSLMDGPTQSEHQFCSMSAESWSAKVIEWKQEYSARKKSAHLIREKECLSLQKKKNWPTPSARDKNGENKAEDLMLKDRPHIDQLPNAVMAECNGLLDQVKNKVPANLREPSGILIKWRLNPSWVEVLMGLPENWTQLSNEWRTEVTDSSCAEMELCPKQPKEPIEYLAKDSEVPKMPDLITDEQSQIMRGLAMIEEGMRMIKEASR